MSDMLEASGAEHMTPATMHSFANGHSGWGWCVHSGDRHDMEARDAD